MAAGANAVDDLLTRVARTPGGRRSPTRVTTVTWAEFAGRWGALAGKLLAEGIRPGDRIAIMSDTRYEWVLCDFAIWAVGAVSVPVYETSSAEQVAWSPC